MTFKQVALKTMILISFGCIANSGYSQTTSAIGRVSGKIVDDKGGPAAGSSVTLRTNGTAKVETFRTVTAKDGTYQFTAVPAGIYSLCVQADSQGSHLNPCMWSDKPQTVTVPKTGGAIVSNPVVE